MTSLFEILKASKTGLAPDLWTLLRGRKYAAQHSAQERELEGVPPLTFSANGDNLLLWSIYGNTVQNGTPTPDSPIMPQGCGDTTENLFSCNIEQGTISAEGALRSADNRVRSDDFIIMETGEYTINALSDSGTLRLLVFEYMEDGTFVSRTPTDWTNVPYTFSLTGKRKMKFVFSYSSGNITPAMVNSVMLNTGSTALPYEPYGTKIIKIPISSGGNNLFDKSNTTVYSAYFNTGGYWLLSSDSKSIKMPCRPNTQYTLSVPNSLAVFRIYEADDVSIEPSSSSTLSSKATAITRSENIRQYTFTTSSTAKVILFQGTNASVEEWFNGLMLNTGSTALPYEPYNHTTTPVYLGEVETTRKVQKLVLNGTENITMPATSSFQLFGVIDWGSDICYCTHFPQSTWADATAGTSNCIGLRSGGNGADRVRISCTAYTSADDFKAYLQQQYANGTPVTVWYVLATPTTGTVNEPLMKIGDYVDSLTATQAGVEIPTIKGNNTLDIDTTVKPSKVYIKYKG